MTTPNPGENGEKLDHAEDGNVKSYSYSGKEFGSFFKKLNMQLRCDTAVTLLDV